MAVAVKKKGRRTGVWVPRVREVACFAGGALLVVGVTAYATTSEETASTQPCPDFNGAVQQVINEKMLMIGTTQPDPSKYFSSGDSGCLGGLAIADIDLSNLIPDLIGMVSSAATTAIQKAVDAAAAKVCTAARNSMGSVISQYNNAINLVGNTPGTIGNYIDTSISKTSSDALNKVSMDWTVKGGVPGTVKIWDGAAVTSTSSNSALVSTNAAATATLSNVASGASAYTAAAANLASAKVALENAQSAARAMSSSGTVSSSAQAQLSQSTANYNAAQAAYNAAQTKVTGGSANATPSTTKTTGGSVF